MNCSNTVSDGFYFWIGKILAELAVGGIVFLVVFLSFVACLLYIGKSK